VEKREKKEKSVEWSMKAIEVFQIWSAHVNRVAMQKNDSRESELRRFSTIYVCLYYGE
jgi:hypothetical protein